MNILADLKAVELFSKVMAGEASSQNIPGYVAQKPHFPATLADKNPLPRSTPEAQGVPSAYLDKFFKELSNLQSSLHCTMILRHGTVIASGQFTPYIAEMPHVTHSLCKSLTATAVGIAHHMGLIDLDEKIVDIFPNKVPLLASKRVRAITVEHLLTMTTSIRFGEGDSMTSKDWIKGFFESDCAQEPGTGFFYNSMNSYMLSAIVQHKTGKSLLDFLKRHLLDKMGIKNIFWETCPMGLQKGGWGCYMTVESMAKLGQLYLQRGKWTVKGVETQLLAAAWVDRAILPKFPREKSAHGGGYGYQIWMSRIEGGYLFNGMFGQYTVILPHHDMVISMTAGCDNLFAYAPTLNLVEGYFGLDVAFGNPLPEKPRTYAALNATLNSLVCCSFPFKNKKDWLRTVVAEMAPIPREAQAVLGSYDLEKAFGSPFPLLLQCMQGNYAPSLTSMDLTIEPDGLRVTFHEPHFSHTIPVGFTQPAMGIYESNGERYQVACTGIFKKNEDDVPVLKLDLCFLETSSVRKIKIFFLPQGKITVKLEETPSFGSILQQFSLGETSVPEFFIKALAIPTEKEYGIYRLSKIISPELKGIRRIK